MLYLNEYDLNYMYVLYDLEDFDLVLKWMDSKFNNCISIVGGLQLLSALLSGCCLFDTFTNLLSLLLLVDAFQDTNMYVNMSLALKKTAMLS